jgi:hypothetical protein
MLKKFTSKKAQNSKEGGSKGVQSFVQIASPAD